MELECLGEGFKKIINLKTVRHKIFKRELITYTVRCELVYMSKKCVNKLQLSSHHGRMHLLINLTSYKVEEDLLEKNGFGR